MPTLQHYLILGALLFSIGIIGVISRRNTIIIYMCIELMLSAVSLTLVAFSRHLNTMDGHVFVFMIMTVAASEAAVGLAIIISMFRVKESVYADEFNTLKG